MPERQHATWGELLREAVEKPGRMLEAYTAFHNFSVGNALLALEQCTRRNLQPGPLNTYNGWLERKRQVRKGKKESAFAWHLFCRLLSLRDSEQLDPSEGGCWPPLLAQFQFPSLFFAFCETACELLEP